MIPADLDPAVGRVKEALREARRAELSAAGPVPLSFRLGERLESHLAEIVVVHDGERWWSNR